MKQEPHPVKGFIALVLSGLAVKWLDDIVDDSDDFEEPRTDSNSREYTELSTTAKAVYASACLTLAHHLEPRICGPVFWSAYALGMIRKPLRSESFPGGPPEWLESTLAGVLATASGGPRLASGIGAAMVAAQIIDDLRDDELREPVRRFSMNAGTSWTRQFLIAVGGLSLGLAMRFTPIWAPILVAGSCLLSPQRKRKE